MPIFDYIQKWRWVIFECLINRWFEWKKDNVIVTYKKDELQVLVNTQNALTFQIIINV